MAACSNGATQGTEVNRTTAGGVCDAPFLLCGGVCTNIASDPANCGSCGGACPSGKGCVDGTCTGSGCPGGAVDCGGLCVDLKTNPLNCGACNNACAPPETCTDGTCTCPPEDVVCGGVCVDISTSNDNCGACGQVCAPDELCANGSCAPRCAAPLSFCENATGLIDPGSCVDLATNTMACGNCQTACNSAETCVNGQCTCPSDLNHALCGTECVDVTTNGNNCGTCGNVCSAETHCLNGTCSSCSSGFFYCPSTTGDPLATCLAQAQSTQATSDGGGDATATTSSPDLACQCSHCLTELADCANDTQCATVWQCAVRSACTSPCWDTMGVCSSVDTTWTCWKWCSGTTTTTSTISTETATHAEALLRCTQANGCGML